MIAAQVPPVESFRPSPKQNIQASLLNTALVNVKKGLLSRKVAVNCFTSAYIRYSLMNIIIRMPVVQEISLFFPVVFLQSFIPIVTSEVTGLFPSGYKPIFIPLRMSKNNIQQPHIDLFHYHGGFD